MTYNIALDPHLKLQRCPHCSIDNPNLSCHTSQFLTATDTGNEKRYWMVYICARCGGVVTASCNAAVSARTVREVYPSTLIVSDVLPDRVKTYLQQAIDSTYAPSGAVMLCASAVDAMLKERGHKTGKLYSRIKKAIEDSVLTDDMGKWAHQVRLDANDERHADEAASMPTVEDAKQVIEFTTTLAELLFVLPAKVTRGIEATTPIPPED